MNINLDDIESMVFYYYDMDHNPDRANYLIIFKNKTCKTTSREEFERVWNQRVKNNIQQAWDRFIKKEHTEKDLNTLRAAMRTGKIIVV